MIINPALLAPQVIGWREMFYRLVQCEASSGVILPAQNVVTAALSRIPESPLLASDERERLEKLFALSSWDPPSELEDESEAIDLIRFLAPQALLEGCWLESVSQAATCHKEVNARLFLIYSNLLGDGKASSLSELYSALLVELEVPLPAVHTWAFAAHSALPEAALLPAVIQLAMARFPRRFFPEILGFTLAHCVAPSQFHRLFSSEALERWGIPSSYFDLRERLRVENAIHAKEAARLYLLRLSLEGGGEEEWRRVQAGFQLHQVLLQDWFAVWREHVAQRPTPQDKVIAIIRQKAPFARGHHQAVRLRGKPLEEWFAPGALDGAALLSELIQTGYFDPAKPEASRFLELAAFDGPMFGVFTEEELGTVREWVSSLGTNQKGASTVPPPLEREGEDRGAAVGALERLTPVLTSALPGGRDLEEGEVTEKNDRRLTNRTLFHQLVNSDRFPAVLAAAKEHVQTTLRRAGRTLRWTRAPHKRFFTYTPVAFESRIAAIYEREITGYQPFQPPPRLTKEEYVWGIEQLAPLILVDGCWLQQIAQAGQRQNPIHCHLFRIYADEVGNGDPRQNHPNVYRRLLENLDIRLPPLDSQAFAAAPRFLDAAFDLPVHLLAISQFPETFLPELLGLNLAIELSGLGRVYLRLIDELDYWGIDPQIIRLHQSIDNLASGHAAIAKEAIERYLDEILLLAGEEERQRHWQRIWKGYLSMQSACRRFKRALAYAFLKRFLPQRARRRFRRLRA